MAAAGHADHVIDLHLAAGAHAKPALDAGIEIDAHRDMAVIEQRDARRYRSAGKRLSVTPLAAAMSHRCD